MKALLLLLPLFALLGCAEDDPEALKQAARKGEFPATFGSEESARKYVGHLFAGGRVDRVRIGMSAYLVVYRHGSGIPVTGIALYRKAGLSWRLISKPPVPFRLGHLQAEARDGKIYVRSDRAEGNWLLYDPETQR